ncbi:MAG: ECF transporter S component [Aristaeellaceae bacterium]
MTERNIHTNQTLRICFCGIMTAIVFVVNYLRIPFMGTSVHMTNALCAMAGMLFGPWLGFAAAGLGSALYDLTAGYGAECLITLVSKGAIAVVAGLIALGVAHKPDTSRTDAIRVVIACVAGALTYVALYMLKTFIFGMWVNGLGMDGTLAKMATKLPGSLINALFASVAGPVVFLALKPALRHAGLLEKM